MILLMLIAWEFLQVPLITPAQKRPHPSKRKHAKLMNPSLIVMHYSFNLKYCCDFDIFVLVLMDVYCCFHHIACSWADCGGGFCNKTSVFAYSCVCVEGYHNLLNVTAFPCFQECKSQTYFAVESSSCHEEKGK